MPKQVDKSLHNWVAKWRMYIFIIVAIGLLFGLSLLITLLSVTGLLVLNNPFIWYGLSFILGLVILILGLILLGYLLLMTKPKGKKK